MKVSYSHISHISHYLCKIHAFSYIFFEHLYDFKTHTYVQVKIKFSKIAFLSKYCKFDIWSYFQFSFSKLRYINFVFFKIWSHFFLIFELDYIVFFFYEKKKFYIKKRSFISSFCYSTFETRIYWISRYETRSLYHFKYRWLSLNITCCLNLVEHYLNLTEHN